MGTFICDLEVDVNGQESFFVDKKVLASFSNRFSKLFGKTTSTKSRLKVIFSDFPGGAKGFELIVRFCYNNGKIEVTPSNVFLLHCAADFMEIKISSDLVKCFEQVQYWTWSEMVSCLKQCQNLWVAMDSSSLLPNFLELFVERLFLLNVSTSFTSSSSHNTSSDKFLDFLEDILFMDTYLLERVIQVMIKQKFDQTKVCAFLYLYQKSKLQISSTSKKRKVVSLVINLLSLLDTNSVSSRGLFHTFSLALSLKISKTLMKKLEVLVGSMLDKATINDLLVPSPHGKKYIYDVNLVLRLLKTFLAENSFYPNRLKKVAFLMDFYLMEVAPDPYLRPSKFLKLAMALPGFARDSFDRISLAIDTYLKVHKNLHPLEKIRVCSVLTSNCELIAKAGKDSNVTRHFRLKNLLHGCKSDNVYAAYIILYAKELDLPRGKEKSASEWQHAKMQNCGSGENYMVNGRLTWRKSRNLDDIVKAISNP